MATHIAEIAGLVSALNEQGINPMLCFDPATGHLDSITFNNKTYDGLIAFAEKFRPSIGPKAKSIMKQWASNPPSDIHHSELGLAGTLLFTSFNHGSMTINGQKVARTQRNQTEFEFVLDNGDSIIVELWAMDSNVKPQDLVTVSKANRH